MNIDFYNTAGRLKRLPRSGWVNRGIDNPETVAEHIFRSQLIAYDLAKELGVDPASCAEMMLVHDLQEALAGDMTPDSGVSKQDKHRIELQAAQDLAALSGNPEYYALFCEFEDQKTLRSRICHDADQLECLTQAFEYAVQYPEKRDVLEDFWPYAEKKISTPPGKKIYAELIQRKKSLAPHI